MKLGLEKEARKAKKVEKAEQEMIQTWQLELEDVEVKGGRVNANR